MKAVILAGGFGTRLWPLSRKKTPKQFLKLTSEFTLLEETINQLNFLNKSDIYVATNSEYKEIVEQIVGNQIPKENILIEPALRDTSACIGLIATKLAKEFPDEVTAIAYADHLIKNVDELKEKLLIAEFLAQKENVISIIEVEAKTPNTNFGYVKLGEKVGQLNNIDIFKLSAFKEKPDLETAQKFLQEGNYVWNTGRYVFKNSVLIEKYKKYSPKTYEILQSISTAINTENEQTTIENLYPTINKISIDFDIMEKLNEDEVRIIKADLGWSDIGSFETLHEEIAKDENNNVIKGNFLGVKTENCLIINTEEKIVTTVHLNDFIIVNTPDALFISPKNSSHEVKKIVEHLKNSNPELI